MTQDLAFTVDIEQRRDYQFTIKWDRPGTQPMLTDSAPPLGQGTGPDSEALLAAAVGNCLTASLLFCMRKFRQAPGTLRTTVSGTLARNDKGRLRVAGLEVLIRMSDPVASIAHFDRCNEQFEDFCTVTESVRNGLAVKVRVLDRDGIVVHDA